MICPDTNVLVTYLARRRDPDYPRAAAMMARTFIHITPTVLLETEWVLRSGFGLAKADVIEKLQRLVSLPNVEIDPNGVVDRALTWAGNGLDLADALHLASTPSDATFVTADVAFARKANTIAGAPRVELLKEIAP
jgi:predicted nucleic acid-binding protein